MWYKKNMNKNDLKYACLFGGGAIRGMAHIGVVRALNEMGVGLGTLAGSSVGAIVAAALAVGYSDEELEKIFLDVDFELFRDINFSKSLALSKGDIFLDGEVVEEVELLENHTHFPPVVVDIDFEVGKVDAVEENSARSGIFQNVQAP